ncbi:ssDNA endodeoxyribonuclease [Puccinia graminis f. sp. tritici]|uniref:SsDNA endodeoxyribonuclease n=1 Tax=Puccinia graminis f. sp. tritici TaxID=56615 RepID=A0A5B0RU19_PUCGR|nr:ssDNA endodeoxyribonuclease [Puccinia graminis f. sp. tritici]
MCKYLCSTARQGTVKSQQLTMNNEEQDGRLQSQVFCCYAPDLRPIAILLSTVHFSARAIIQLSHTSIHIQVEIGKILQAHAYIDKNVFTDWHFKPPILPNSQKERAKNLGDSDDSNEEESGKRKNDDDEEEEDEFDVKFEVSMSSLIECLNIFGTASSHKTYTKNFADSAIDDGSSVTGLPAKRRFDDDSLVYQKGKPGPSKARKLPTSAVRISYDGEGHPLVLLIEDSGVVTRCSLMTYEADELAQMEFPVERQMVHLIMKSDWLKSAFSQFDDKSGTDITFMFTPTPSTGWSAPTEPTTYHNNRHKRDEDRANRPTFRIEVDGDLGCYTIDFPNDKDILDTFMCKIPEGLDPQDLHQLGFVRNSYKLSHILKIKKALDVSSKTSLRVDDTGFLSLQLLIPLEEASTMKRKCGYVEFMCVPIEDG